MNKKLILLVLIIFIAVGAIFIGVFMFQSKQKKEVQSVVEQKTTKSTETIFDDAEAVKKMTGIGFTINHKKMGDSIDMQRVLLKVNGATERGSFFDELGNKEYNAKKGTKFVFVNISITNQETASFYIPFDAFTLIDNFKREYGAYRSIYVYKLADSIEEELQPGIEQTGVIVFELPISSESYALATSSIDTKEGYLIILEDK